MKKQKNQKLPLLKIIIALIILLLAVWLIVFSLREYDRQQAALGIIVCNDKGDCIKTVHIHADVEFDLCGQTYILPREGGVLSGLHTHKEKNYLHFHDELKLDPVTRKELSDKRLSLQEIIDMFELDPQEFCGRADVEISALVNGQEPAEGLDYNWNDGDDMTIIFK